MGVNSLPKTYLTASGLRFEPGPFYARVQHANHSATEPLYVWGAGANVLYSRSVAVACIDQVAWHRGTKGTIR